ncbi:MAG: hypothetical protein OHK0028_10300 [Deltaproteobacteria bacterium]
MTTLRNAKGEAVMLAVMGIMMVGGVIFRMFSGHSHMFGMHGGSIRRRRFTTGSDMGVTTSGILGTSIY